MSTPQKAKSPTKSSRSDTSSPSSGPETPVQFVKGVGPRMATVFSSRGITSVGDLLTFFPRAYEDRSQLLEAGAAVEGQKSSLLLTVMGSQKIPLKNRRQPLFVVRTTDGTSPVQLKWFYTPPGIEAKLKPGVSVIATGTIKKFQGIAEIIHPELSFNIQAAATGDSIHQGRIIPVYVEIDGVNTRTLRVILNNAIEKFLKTIPDDLPEYLRTRHQLPGVQESIKSIHFPDQDEKNSENAIIQNLIEFKSPAHRRLIYEEFLKFEYLVLKQRLKQQRAKCHPLDPQRLVAHRISLEEKLPFQLTGDQKKTITTIQEDFTKKYPMNRLVQGDVGSGKTAVAFITTGMIVKQGGQVALMAPTEILAEQHYLGCKKLLQGEIHAELLTGKTTASERNQILEKLKSGIPMVLIGTHALIEDPVEFKGLQLIIIDEQHRFGVEQRRSLRNKGLTQTTDGHPILPHQLVMTATPIPRTLALTAYGDLSVSLIKERPPGRSPVLTKVCKNNLDRSRAIQLIREELQKGHQAYYICPLVTDSEAEGFENLKSVVTESARLQNEVFPEFKIELLHGQLKPAEKEAIMTRFKNKESNVLVSTTVVEVGVDVPDATVIVIEHAERFGLSQLHQLRGRVGRSSLQSYCFLFSHPNASEITRTRLGLMEKTSDGFVLAEEDLKIRGPGEFLGVRQSGELPFRIAELIRDGELLELARNDAEEILKTDPNLELPENTALKQYFNTRGKLQSERFQTA